MRVFCPLKTRIIYPPSGLTSRRTTTRKRPYCAMFGRLILTTSLLSREQMSGNSSALVLGSGWAVGRAQSQVEFEHIDTRFTQDTKITRLGILSDQRFYLLRCDRGILSAWCPASIHHPVHLEQGGFDRDIRIEATSTRRDRSEERRVGKECRSRW